MATYGKKPNVGKRKANVMIKQEEDLLGEDWRTPEKVNLKLVKEEEHSHSVVELDAVQQFSPMPQTHEYIKTELMLDEPLDDQSNSDLASDSQEYNQRLEIGECQQARISRAGEDSETSGLCRNTYPKEVLATHKSHMRGKRTYQCEVCQQSFVKKKDLKRHSMIHDDNRVLNCVCGRCNFKCLDTNSLKSHMNTHHPEDRRREFACQLCEKQFYARKDLLQHVKRFHTGDTSLKMHMLHCHSDKKSSKSQRYQCKDGDKDYGNRYSLFEHSKEHTGEKEFTNQKSFRAHITGGHQITDKETVNEFTLMVPTSKEAPIEIQPPQSVKTKLEEQSETYKVQPFTSETQIAKDPYERTKTDLALNEEFLDDKNASASEMDAEQVGGLSIEDKNIENCKLCHNIYPKELMEAHMREVHCEKGFRCEFCQRSFDYKSQFTRHIMTHDDNRPRNYACGQCGSKYLYEKSLKLHLRTQHQAIKKFECNLCEKEFNRKCELQVHMRFHTGDTHNCEQCGLRFAKKSDFQMHIEICKYSGTPFKKQRYKCSFCEKHYGSEGSLRAHNRKHTGLPWKCTICTKKFSLKNGCRQHISKCHKIADKEVANAFLLNIPTAKDL